MKQQSLLLAGITLLLVGAGCASTTETATTSVTDTSVSGADASYTLTDISEHSSSSDCWMAIGDGVYDVTDYISTHPGGDEITRGCGIDATAYFEGERDHAGVATTLKENFRIGNFVQ